jgi:aspartyl-tRNA synthetase
MYEAFRIAGYSKEQVNEEFGGMVRAFHYGAPPHAGIAPCVDRIVMLLADEPNIRETIAFPLNQNAQDLLMGAPTEIAEDQLKELHITARKPPPKGDRAH